MALAAAAAAVRVHVSTLAWRRRAMAAQTPDTQRDISQACACCSKATPSLSLPPPPGCWSCTIRRLGSSRTASNAWTITRESGKHSVVSSLVAGTMAGSRSAAQLSRVRGGYTPRSWNIQQQQQQRRLRALQRDRPQPQQRDPCCRAVGSKRRDWLRWLQAGMRRLHDNDAVVLSFTAVLGVGTGRRAGWT